jgi:hypothetical protein
MGVHALLGFAAALSMSRLADVDLNGGELLVKLSYGTEFSVLAYDGSWVELDLFHGDERAARWLKHNRRELEIAFLREIDRRVRREVA